MSTDPSPDANPEPFIATPRVLGTLDQKILLHFPGLVVRKDLTHGLKQNAVVPTYVLEYLLGQHCATEDNDAIKSGLESVQRILAKHYVHRNQAQLIKSTIKEKGRHKVIDKLTVELNDKGGFYEAQFTNLGLKKVPISDDFVRRFPKLLVGGIWCITDLTYDVVEDPKASPWQIDTLKPIQVANVDYEGFLKGRAQFTTEEWMDVLMQSIGFNPQMFERRAKLLTLIRLIPYCERNYNLLELGPKGTGKSHIYAEFSPHGMLISGSEVTTPKLFVSNATGKIGLVGYWDCICFDEFAGKDKRIDKALVDIMKNYMANRTFSRGIEQLTAEASMVFMGNTKKSVAHMLKHTHFFEPLPDKYIDSAFLDRIHAYNPGWEVAPIRHELFSNGYGFVVDFIAEILKRLRTEDFTGAYKEHFEVTSEVSTRDQTGFEKTFSGLMKILFPNGDATPAEIEELLAFSMEARRRVREHILRIDDTFKRHDFVYRSLKGGTNVTVLTPEEKEYSTFAGPRREEPKEGFAETADAAETQEREGIADHASPSGVAADPSNGQTEEEQTSISDIIRSGESNTVEFKSSLRMNLHTNRPDPKIEHAVLKTIAAFLNTHGGTVVIGADDKGTALGLDNDGFQTEDKINQHLANLIRDRLGPHHAFCLHPQFVDYAGKRLLIVRCDPAKSPAYVKEGNAEYFYVRTGATTSEVPASQIHAFVEQRFSN